MTTVPLFYARPHKEKETRQYTRISKPLDFIIVQQLDRPAIRQMDKSMDQQLAIDNLHGTSAMPICVKNPSTILAMEISAPFVGT